MSQTMLRGSVSTPVLIGLLLCISVAPARAEEPPDPDAPGISTSERLQRLVTRVKLAQNELETLQAEFVQRQESELFVEPAVHHGVFSYAAPDRVRWDYLAPEPLTIVVQDKQMITWYRDLGRVEERSVGRYSTQIFKYLGASSPLQSLLEYFNVVVRFPDEADAPYRLDLIPRFERVAKRIESMTVWIDRHHYLPERIRYSEANGDSTEYRFEGFKVNETIPGERFKLDLPDDVEVRQVEADRASS